MKRVIRANDGRLRIIYQSSRNRVHIRDYPLNIMDDPSDSKEKNLYESYRIKSTSDANLGGSIFHTFFELPYDRILQWTKQSNFNNLILPHPDDPRMILLLRCKPVSAADNTVIINFKLIAITVDCTACSLLLGLTLICIQCILPSYKLGFGTNIWDYSNHPTSACPGSPVRTVNGRMSFPTYGSRSDNLPELGMTQNMTQG